MISIVVPVFNEEENIEPLLAEIAAVAAAVPVTEVLYVDDGSTDGTPRVLKSLRARFPFLRVLRHDRCGGQSAGLWTGVQAARNEIVVTLDGDGQNDPADISRLLEVYKKESTGNPAVMVAGQRRKRNDSWVKRISSRLANRIRSGLLKDGTRDTGCSLKLFRRSDYLRLPYFNHMHRFLPALMMRDGVKVVHADVSHRPRARGVSKYGTLDRLAVGVADLWGVWWLLKRPRALVPVSEEQV